MSKTNSSANVTHRGPDRVLLIFEYLTETENVGKTLTEIANELDAPKSSLFPILRTLVSRGYLHYNSLTYQYFIGYKLYEIGTKYANDDNLDDAIYQVMVNIANNYNVTVALGELVAGDVLFLQKVDLFEKLRLYKAVGRRTPAYANALGKVLLSDKTIAEIKKLYPDGLIPITAKTITDFSVLEEQLEQVRQLGFARSSEESTPYVGSVAVPIIKAGTIVYGLEVSMSIFEYNENRERQILYALYDAKSKIENFIKL